MSDPTVEQLKAVIIAQREQYSSCIYNIIRMLEGSESKYYREVAKVLREQAEFYGLDYRPKQK